MDKRVKKQTRWYISRYWDFLREYEDIMEASPSHDGVRGSDVTSPTEMKVIRAEKVKKEIDIIERGLECVKEEHRDAIMDNIINKMPFPHDVSRRTYEREMGAFIYYVAKMKDFI